jgi:hypothetical protein
MSVKRKNRGLLDGISMVCNKTEAEAFEERGKALLSPLMHEEHRPSEEFRAGLRQRLLEERRQRLMKKESLSPVWGRIISALRGLGESLTPRRLSVGLAVLVLAAVLGQTLLNPSAPPGAYSLSGLIISPAQAAEGFTLEPERPDALGVAADGVFLLKSAMPVSTDLVRQYLEAEPKVDLTVESVGNQTWRVKSKQTLASGQVLKLSLDTTVQATDGSTEQREFKWAFQIKSAFKIMGSLPRDASQGVPTNTGIELTFSHENVGDLASHFRIEPQVDGEFKRFRRIIAFVPKQPLKAGTIYRVTVDRGLPLNGSEERLAADYTFAFETEDTSAYQSYDFSLNRDRLTFLPGDEQIIQLYRSDDNLKALDVKAYAYADTASFVTALQDRAKLPYWSTAWDRYRFPTDGLREAASFSAPIVSFPTAYGNEIEAVKLPQSLDAGWYVLELKSRTATRQILVQVSPVAAFVEATKNELVVWAQDTRTGRPAAHAEVSLLGGATLGRTGDDGLLRTTLPASLAGDSAKRGDIKVLSISTNGVSLLMDLAEVTNGIYWPERTYASDSYWSYLYTDRPQYQRTDAINFWGLAKPRDGEVTGGELKAVLRREGYFDYFSEPVTVAETTVTANARGIFQGAIKIDNLKSDYYTLTLMRGDTVVRSSYVYVASYTKPAYQLELSADRRAVFEDEPIKIKATAKFFEGTPVPGMKLKVTFSGGDRADDVQEVVTGDDGSAELAYVRSGEDCRKAHSRSCSWPSYVTATAEPAGSEAGDVNAQLSLQIFGPRTYVTSSRSDVKGETTFNLKARRVDLSHLDKVMPWDDGYYGVEPAPGQVIEARVTENHYKTEEIGRRYDFVNKVTVPYYSYRQWTVEQPVRQLTADAAGLAAFKLKTEPGMSYEVTFTWRDEQGRVGEITDWASYYDGYGYWSQSTGEVFYLGINKESVGLGEQVTATLRRDDAPVASGAGRFLFLKHQSGLRDAVVGGAASYSFTFAAADVPNVFVKGVYWNGRFFEEASNGVTYRASDRELNIKVKTDKASYRPGETVKLTAQVTDKSGKPAAADLNVNLVDEAYYEVANDVASPLASVYRSLDPGVLFSLSSHVLPVNTGYGAEKGGCFIAGTMVRMADGRRQPIEAIKTGDQVLTYDDPITRLKAAGTVRDTYRHVVSDLVVVNHRLTATPEHRVFADLGFKTVGELELGDVLLDENGNGVPVTSLERQHGKFTVYNLEIAPQHTFFAEGLYVHNEKGGGPREFFVDTATFTQVTTGRDGRGETTFKLPDNLTSWRITVQGISIDLGVGVSVTKLPVRLPAFVDFTVAKSYLLGDRPLVRLRAFGTAFRGDEEVKFSLTAPSLFAAPQTAVGQPFKAVSMELAELKPGRHDLTAAMSYAGVQDAVKLPIDVVASRLMMRKTVFSAPARVGLTLPRDAETDARVVISDQAKDELFEPLAVLSWAWGSRIDQRLVRRAATIKVNEAFGFENEVPAFDSAAYATGDGTYALLPYSSGDLHLTSLLLAMFPSYFDRTAAASLFSARLLYDRQMNQDEVSDALLGAAASGAPVLTALDAWSGQDKLAPLDRLKLAAAYMVAGEGEKARPILQTVLKEFAQRDGAGLVLNVGKSVDDRAEATVIAAWLAAKLDLAEHSRLWFGYEHLDGTDEPFYLERAAYLLAALDRRGARPAEITYTIDGREEKLNLSGGHLSSFSIDPAAREFKVKAVTGDLRVVLLAMRAAGDQELRQDKKMSVTREYRVNGQAVTSLKASDLVEVILRPQVGSVYGRYRLTDYLPSGLIPVQRPYADGNWSPCTWRMTDSDEESVSFAIWSSDWSGYCSKTYAHYFARVKTAGTYVAEPAVLQSYDHPEAINASAATTVVIAP